MKLINLKMDELLIEKVREHKALYDHSSTDYRDQQIRQNAKTLEDRIP